MEEVELEKIKNELQRTKEDLGDLEKYIEEFSTFLPLAVCTLTPLWIIVDINKAFEELTGFNPLEIIGKPLETLFLEKEKVEKIKREIFQIKVLRNKELTLITQKGKEILINLSISVRKGREENFIGYFVSLIDITELKKFQKNLEEKVKERTKELQEKIDELEKFHKLTVGRELKMIELKKEIEQLKKELEKYKPT